MKFKPFQDNGAMIYVGRNAAHLREEQGSEGSASSRAGNIAFGIRCRWQQGGSMAEANLSKMEDQALKMLAQWKKPSVKWWMWICFLGTAIFWVRNWHRFAQNWVFLVANIIIWLAFNIAIYYEVTYNPVVHDLVQRRLGIKTLQ